MVEGMEYVDDGIWFGELREYDSPRSGFGYGVSDSGLIMLILWE